MDAGVEGMMLSPGYSYDKAPDQQHFMARERIQSMFRRILSNREPRWRFNMSPLFLEFLMGKRNLECTPWGMPTYNIFGWQRPCYLIQEGYTDSFQQLLDTTSWEKYGYESGNPKCSNCMMHSGYEASAVHYTFSLRGLLATVRSMLFSRYGDEAARAEVAAEKKQPVLVQIDAVSRPSLRGATMRVQDNLAEGVAEALDYRGDVTVTLKNGDTLTGYVFDRDETASQESGKLRMILAGDRRRVTVSSADIDNIAFTGRDMADGRSWEAWVRKYTERKAAGEKNIELVPEAID
jgi:hypothetical protein